MNFITQKSEAEAIQELERLHQQYDSKRFFYRVNAKEPAKHTEEQYQEIKKLEKQISEKKKSIVAIRKQGDEKAVSTLPSKGLKQAVANHREVNAALASLERERVSVTTEMDAALRKLQQSRRDLQEKVTSGKSEDLYTEARLEQTIQTLRSEGLTLLEQRKTIEQKIEAQKKEAQQAYKAVQSALKDAADKEYQAFQKHLEAAEKSATTLHELTAQVSRATREPRFNILGDSKWERKMKSIKTTFKRLH